MKVFLVIIVSLFIACNNPGPGFTNKAEAENRWVNGFKDGKWFEYVDSNYNITIDTNSPYYSLIVYMAGKPCGIVRVYYKSNKIAALILYRNGERDGIEKIYYQDGKLKGEIPSVDGKINGIEKQYYENGKLSV